MKVKKLFKNKEIIVNHKVNGIKNNSKEVTNNDIFIAHKGYSCNGAIYINEAILNGAKTIVTDSDYYAPNINIIKVTDTLLEQARIVKVFFSDITKKIKLIGVTGTNGKTTISTLLADYLEYNGHKVLLIGTNGIRINKTTYQTNNTTPDIIMSLNAIYEAYKKGVRWVIMEVSSHAIKELRVKGFKFNIGIFSNLTHDHMDYHKTMEDYAYTKGFFISNVSDAVILNMDSPYFKLYSRMANAKVINYGIKSNSLYKALSINKNSLNETVFKVYYKGEKKNIKTSFIGEFNIYNIMAVLATIDYLGFLVDDFINFLSFYVRISGRMEMIIIKGRTFIIDYAHTPDGILNVCQSIKEYTNNRLIVIVGCGGNRDNLKRPKIGEIASSYADYVIFTNDNPRDEAEEKIISDIIKGVKNDNYEVIYDRQDAILKAIKLSGKNEVIAILGKGSESEQIIKGIKYPFNDLEIVKKLMKRVE